MSDYNYDALIAVYNDDGITKSISDPSFKEFTGRRVDIRRYGVQAGINQGAELQAALTAANGEVELWFPPGLEFQTDRILNLPSGTRLVGVPGQSKLCGIGTAFWQESPPGTWTVVYNGLLGFSGVSNVSIEGLTLYTQGISEGTSGNQLVEHTTVPRCFWFQGVVSDVTIQDCVVRHFWFTSLMGSNAGGDSITNLRLQSNNIRHIAGNGIQTGQNQRCLYAFNYLEDIGNGDTGNADWLMYASRRCENFLLVGNTGTNVSGGYKFGTGLNHKNITLIGNEALGINDNGGLILEDVEGIIVKTHRVQPSSGNNSAMCDLQRVDYFDIDLDVDANGTGCKGARVIDSCKNGRLYITHRSGDPTNTNGYIFYAIGNQEIEDVNIAVNTSASCFRGIYLIDSGTYNMKRIRVSGLINTQATSVEVRGTDGFKLIGATLGVQTGGQVASIREDTPKNYVIRDCQRKTGTQRFLVAGTGGTVENNQGFDFMELTPGTLNTPRRIQNNTNTSYSGTTQLTGASGLNVSFNDWFAFNNSTATTILTNGFTNWLDSEQKTFIGDGNTTIPYAATGSPKWYLKGGTSKTLAVGETLTIWKYNGDYYEV